MMAQQRSTIVGVFDDRQQADRAVDALRRAGFRDDQLGVAWRHEEEAVHVAGSDQATDETRAGEGAAVGALAGLGLGAVAGIGVLSGVIPVIGPAIAAGTLGVILTNAAAGAGIGGLVGALVGAGIPEAEAQYYQNEFEAGRMIVTVQAEGRADDAMAILRRYGAVDWSSRGDLGTGSTRAAATEPLDVPVRSEDVLETERVGGPDTATRGTDRPAL
ncbi:MAG TPA: general stress protein [Isosphaeraceae bacterium]|nr:general stress protein [Isosphaeraceae bacterium]